MKLVLLTSFLLWARHGEGGALKCVPGAENDSCSDIKESGPDIESSREVECEAGTEWESNCHACRCTTAGFAECVKQDKICDVPKWPDGSDGIPLLIPTVVRTSATSLPSGSECAAGSAWRSQCNDCVCSPQGLRHCTEKACPGEDLEPPLSCEPHSQWKKECNTCWCTSDGRAECTLMGCNGIPSDMHFSDEEDESSTPTVAEPELLEKVPDLISNTLVESDENTSYDTTVQGLVKNDFNIVEEKLNDVNLKVLDDIGQNEIDTKLNNAEDNSNREFVQNVHNGQETSSAHVKLNQKEKDLEQLEMQNEFPDDETRQMLVLDLNDAFSPYKKERENLLSSKEIDYHKHFEELPSPYVDQNSFKHHILKRSVCKPNQDFQNECNTCKCSATGQSYACTQNECMETNKEKEDVDKEVEVFKESEGIDHIERHTVCKPHAMFFVGCNPCNCNGDGTDFSCTNKACPLPEDVEVFHELNDMKPIVPYKNDKTSNNKQAPKL